MEGWLNNFQNELKALVSQEASLEENYQVLCEKIGCDVHPCLAKKEAGHYPSLKNTDYGEKFAVLLNHRIDGVTLKLLGFLMGQYKLSSLKLSNNAMLEGEADEIKRILDKEGTVPHMQTNSPRSTSSGTLSATTRAATTSSRPACDLPFSTSSSGSADWATN